jgi:gluconolactonase
MNNLRYPDPSIEVLDPSFLKYRLYAASVEPLATGFRWAEGPVWFGDGRYLLFSDIPNNRIMRYDDTSGLTSVFRAPANYANGNSRDKQGRLISCEHGSRAITRTEYDGSITVLADRFEGKRFNSPNDIVCKSDGSIWFTDPPFGVMGEYEGHKATPELSHGVYRIDPISGLTTRVVDDVQFPNGLCFSPDEKLLYLIGRIDKEPARYIFSFAVNGELLSNKKVLVSAGTEGGLDGMRCDADGNIWAGFGFTGVGNGTSEALDGVRVFNPQGQAIGHIHLPERCANLCFGGAKGNRLFMASSHSLYSLYVETRGAVRF